MATATSAASPNHALNLVSTYEYDREGNRTLESHVSTPDVQYQKFYQTARITYDELNRIATFSDPKAVIRYQYDAASNRRRVTSTSMTG